jgi:hypothetical protein
VPDSVEHSVEEMEKRIAALPTYLLKHSLSPAMLGESEESESKSGQNGPAGG